MKHVFLTLFCACCLMGSSQSTTSEEVKQIIVGFFKAFHEQDSTKLKSLVKEGMLMQSVVKNKEGATILKATEFSKFLHSISTIPKEHTFKEKLLDFSIQIDGDMANVWTPYEFWYNGKFSHCGVNSFQLIRESEGWKIIYLIDTRRRDGCNKS